MANDDIRRSTDDLRQQAEETLARCQRQVDAGVDLPRALFDLARFSLVLGRPFAALTHCIQGVDSDRSDAVIESALRAFDNLQRASGPLKGFEWCHRFLSLARQIRSGDPNPHSSDAEAVQTPLTPPVVIVAGYCDRAASEEDQLAMLDGFRHFRGTIISGGTRAGICEVVGQLQDAYPGALRTLGYVPRQLPSDVQLDARYAEHRHSDGLGFSPLEPLHYWNDLAASHVPVDRIRLLSIGGGEITRIECQMTMALGGRVAIAIPPRATAQQLAGLELFENDHRCSQIRMGGEEIQQWLRHPAAEHRH